MNAPPRRFYVDLSLFGRKTTGVLVYSIHMAKRLEREFDCQVLVPSYLADHFAHPLVCPAPLTVRGIPVLRRWWSPGMRAPRLGAETFVYAPHMKGIFFQSNQVVTLHDMIHHHQRTRNFVQNAFTDFVLPGLLRRIRAVMTVSETSRREIAAFYGIDPARIHVVPNGIDLARWTPGPQKQPDPPFLLTVSANRPYKNTVELLDQHDRWRGYRLKIVSSASRYGTVIRRRVRELGLEAQVDFLENVPEPDLIQLYRDCVAVVYPSRMEGFGRPALEAMAVGRPVILSDIPVHREIFSDAAIFVTPGDAASWSAAFSELSDRGRLPARLDAGLALAQRFDWDRAAETLVRHLLTIEPGLSQLRRSAHAG